VLDTIKSYLVGLGFQVNNDEYNQATRTINELGRVVQSQTTGMAKNFAIASTAVVGAITAITASVAGLVTEVAKADLEYQKFANRMWTSKAAAKEMKMSMDALGESMEDIAFTPELRSQYGELIALGRQMNTPTDSGDQLKNIRSIMFEFKKLKLEVAYAMEWVAYYLGKYLGGPLTNIKKQLSDFNQKITQAMPEWTKKVAQVLAIIMNVGMAGLRFVKDLYNGIERVFDSLPKGIQKATVAILAAWALLRMSPVGLIMTAITAVLILLEDFYGYLDGRESSSTLAPIWQKLIDWFNNTSNLITVTKDDIQELWDTIADSSIVKSSMKLINSYFEFLKEMISLIWDILVGVLDIFEDIFNELLDSGALAMVVQLFTDLLDTISDLFLGIVNMSKEMRKFWREAMGTATAKKVWQWFKEMISFNVKMIATLGRGILGIIDVVALAMQGKFTEAAMRGKRILSDFTKGMTSAVKGERTDSTGGTGFQRFLNAISGQESGGDYEAVNGRTGAAGKYQIMPENWPSWSEQAGLPPNSPMTPGNQEIVAQYKLHEYYTKYGARGAAIAWYAGEGAVDYSEYAKNRKQGNGDEPSMNEYANAILERMGDSTTNYSSAPPVNYSGLANARENYNMFNQNLASTYQPKPSTYSSAGNSLAFGDINLYIGGTTATTDQISTAVTDGITQAQERQVARNMRELRGVYG
jgi:hypothetical protein